MEWTILVTSQGRIITLVLSHNAALPVPLNALFAAESFFTTDDELQDTACTVISKQMLVNTNGSRDHMLYATDTVEYSLQTSGQPYFLFKDRHKATRIYVEL